MSCAETGEPIEMPFWKKTRVGQRNYVLGGDADPQGEGAMFGIVWAIQKHWQSSLQRLLQCRCGVRCKGIIQSPIMSCSRKDNYICQANANSILKISGHRQCGLSAAKGVVGLHSAGDV